MRHAGLPVKAATSIVAGVLALGLSACSGDVDTEGDGVRLDVDVTETPSVELPGGVLPSVENTQ